MERIERFQIGAGRAAVGGRFRRGLTRMRLGGVVCVVVCGVALSGCGGASTPSGSYTTKISPAEGLGRLTPGTWTIAFGKGGSYTIEKSREIGLATGPGSYYRGTTLVITPLSELAHPCGPGSATGRYRLKLSGDKLRFIRIVDNCQTRSAILAHTFTKAH
jgi:hypothetical protein